MRWFHYKLGLNVTGLPTSSNDLFGGNVPFQRMGSYSYIYGYLINFFAGWQGC